MIGSIERVTLCILFGFVFILAVSAIIRTGIRFYFREKLSYLRAITKTQNRNNE